MKKLPYTLARTPLGSGHSFLAGGIAMVVISIAGCGGSGSSSQDEVASSAATGHGHDTHVPGAGGPGYHSVCEASYIASNMTLMLPLVGGVEGKSPDTSYAQSTCGKFVVDIIAAPSFASLFTVGGGTLDIGADDALNLTKDQCSTYEEDVGIYRKAANASGFTYIAGGTKKGVWIGPASDDPIATFAAQCDAAIGASVPDFNCDDGDLMTPANLVDAQGDCDFPNRLNKECDPGSRFQALKGTQPGDQQVIVAHCRKQNHSPGFYGDIAVIQYNKQTGATCFYQALGNLDGHVKAPIKGSNGNFWLTPQATKGLGCVGCHDNGPIIRSPYIMQFPAALALKWDDVNFNSNQHYHFVGNDFQDWKASKVTAGGNICNDCHRMGTSTFAGCNATFAGTSLLFAEIATNPSEVHKHAHNPQTSPIWMPPMPPVFTGTGVYSAMAANAAARIKACAMAWRTNAPLPAGCAVSQFTGPNENPIIPTPHCEAHTVGNYKLLADGEAPGPGTTDYRVILSSKIGATALKVRAFAGRSVPRPQIPDAVGHVAIGDPVEGAAIRAGAGTGAGGR